MDKSLTLGIYRFHKGVQFCSKIKISKQVLLFARFADQLYLSGVDIPIASHTGKCRVE